MDEDIDLPEIDDYLPPPFEVDENYEPDPEDEEFSNPKSSEDLIGDDVNDKSINCPGAKKRGLVDINGGWWPDCDCFDEVYMPLNQRRKHFALILKNLGPDAMVRMGARLFPKTIVKMSKRLLKQLIDQKNRLRNRISLRANGSERLGIVGLKQRMAAIEIEHGQIKNRILSLKEPYDAAQSAISSKRKSIFDLQQYLLTNRGNLSPQQISSINQQINDLISQKSSLESNLRNIIEQDSTLKQILESKTSEYKRMKAERKALNDKVREIDEEVRSLNRDGLNLLASDFEKIKRIIGVDRFFEMLVYLISRLSLVQKHECKEGVSLDEETCKCSICAEGQMLCDLGQTWINSTLGQITDVFGRPPNTAIADQLNTCINECCGKQELTPREWAGGTIFDFLDYFNIVDPCICECKDISPEGGGDAKPMELKQCPNDPDSCQETFSICKEKHPPDDAYGIQQENRPEWSSDYYWSDQDCEWKCKELNIGGKTVQGNPVDGATGCEYQIDCFYCESGECKKETIALRSAEAAGFSCEGLEGNYSASCEELVNLCTYESFSACCDDDEDCVPTQDESGTINGVTCCKKNKSCGVGGCCDNEGDCSGSPWYVCCPSPRVVCQGKCCEEGEECTNGKCCPSGQVWTGKECCEEEKVCFNPFGESTCAEILDCCPPAKAINGECCKNPCEGANRCCDSSSSSSSSSSSISSLACDPECPNNCCPDGVCFDMFSGIQCVMVDSESGTCTPIGFPLPCPHLGSTTCEQNGYLEQCPTTTTTTTTTETSTTPNP